MYGGIGLFTSKQGWIFDLVLVNRGGFWVVY